MSLFTLCIDLVVHMNTNMGNDSGMDLHHPLTGKFYLLKNKLGFKKI